MKPNRITYYVLVPPHDGPVAIMQVIDNAKVDTCIKQFTVANWKPKWVRRISADDIPKERTFRNAWRFRSGIIQHDIYTAKQIHLQKIRIARGPLLEKLDLEYMHWDEQNHAGNKAAVAQRKQYLRDLPATLDLSKCKTLKDIVATWPQELPNPYTEPVPEPPPSLLDKIKARLGLK
jgi:hypothetical protein